MSSSKYRDRIVVLLICAIGLTLNPANASAFVDLDGIHWTVSELRMVPVLDNELGQSYNHAGVGIEYWPPLRFFERDSSFDFGAGTASTDKFVQYLSLATEGEVTHGVGQGQLHGSRVYHMSLNGPAGFSSVYPNVCALKIDVRPESSKDSSNVDMTRYKGVIFLLSDIVGNILAYELCPLDGHSLSEGANGRVSGYCRQCLSSLIGRVPPKHSEGDIVRSARSGEEKLIAKCSNFTVVIGWDFPFVHAATISSDDDFILRIADDDYRSGFELGNCYRINGQKENQHGEQFHIRLLSDDGSWATWEANGKKRTFFNHRVFLKFKRGPWFELLGLTDRGR